MKWICPICNLPRRDSVRVNDSLKHGHAGRCEPIEKLCSELGLAEIDVQRHATMHLRLLPAGQPTSHADAALVTRGHGNAGAPEVHGAQSLARKPVPSGERRGAGIIDEVAALGRPAPRR